MAKSIFLDQIRVEKGAGVLFRYGSDHWNHVEMQRHARDYQKRIGGQNQGTRI